MRRAHRAMISPTRAMTADSDWPADQEAFSHSRICATLMTGAGIAQLYNFARAEGNTNTGRTEEVGGRSAAEAQSVPRRIFFQMRSQFGTAQRFVGA